MAKNSANEAVLGTLHAKVASVFIKVCETYEARLDAPAPAEDEPLPDVEPNPAMMGAMTKFLKDNSISFDTEEIATLSDTELRLAQRRKQRAKLINLTQLAVGSDG